jgi:putative DNA primase/helicase
MLSKEQRVKDARVRDIELNCPYYIEGLYLKKKSDKPEAAIIARKSEITEILRDIDTGKINLTLSFYYAGDTQQVVIPRGFLTKRNLPKLLEYGVDVSDHKAAAVLEWLSFQEETVTVKNIHSRVGFGYHNDTFIFKHHNAIGIDSTYKGALLIKPQGSYDQWKSIINDEVVGYSPLELALSIGLSAPVASLISKETGLEVIIAHIFGDSTLGKTTAARVAVSPFGYPHLKEGGLIKSWNATSNAILGQLRHIYGIPMAFDEASMQDGEFSKFIYQLAGGRDKDRMNQEGQLQETAQWEGIILSTAEHSLLNKSSKNVGIQMRLFEFDNIQWTRSAENSDALKEGLLKNYGHAGPIFVQYLMNIGVEAIVSQWRKFQKHFLESIEERDHFSSRIADKMAIFMVTADLANRALELDLDLKNISTLLLEMTARLSDNRNLGKNAYEYFLEKIIKHHSCFSINGEPETGNQFWGKLVIKGGKLHEIYVFPDVFERLLVEGNFQNSSVVLNKWRERGWIDCDRNKFTRKKTLKVGTENRVHVIRILEDILPNQIDVQDI